MWNSGVLLPFTTHKGLVVRVRWLMTGMVCAFAFGCGGGKSYKELPTDPAYPVKGKVLLVDGRPAGNERLKLTHLGPK